MFVPLNDDNAEETVVSFSLTRFLLSGAASSKVSHSSLVAVAPSHLSVPKATKGHLRLSSCDTKLSVESGERLSRLGRKIVPSPENWLPLKHVFLTATVLSSCIT